MEWWMHLLSRQSEFPSKIITRDLCSKNNFIVDYRVRSVSHSQHVAPYGLPIMISEPGCLKYLQFTQNCISLQCNTDEVSHLFAGALPLHGDAICCGRICGVCDELWLLQGEHLSKNINCLLSLNLQMDVKWATCIPTGFSGLSFVTCFMHAHTLCHPKRPIRMADVLCWIACQLPATAWTREVFKNSLWVLIWYFDLINFLVAGSFTGCGCANHATSTTGFSIPPSAWHHPQRCQGTFWNLCHDTSSN